MVSRWNVSILGSGSFFVGRCHLLLFLTFFSSPPAVGTLPVLFNSARVNLLWKGGGQVRWKGGSPTLLVQPAGFWPATGWSPLPAGLGGGVRQ